MLMMSSSTMRTPFIYTARYSGGALGRDQKTIYVTTYYYYYYYY